MPVSPLDTAVKTKAQLWDDGCQTCGVRNAFVVPEVVRCIQVCEAKLVLDIGAGTGFISRSAHPAVGPDVHWTLIDLDGERLDFAVSAQPPGMDLTAVKCDFVDQFSPICKFDLAIVTYTLLEIIDTESFFQKVVKCLRPGGVLLVALPDNLEDVYRQVGDDPSKFSAFIEGSIHLDKVDKFTGDPYPFRALRTERLVAMALAAGLALFEMRSHEVAGERTTYSILGHQMPDVSAKGSAYLRLALKAMEHAKRPLTPREILSIAESEGFLPAHLYGATMHRTLNARLSEHIRYASASSEFYRTAPSTFYHHALASRPDTPSDYKRVHIGALRSKAIRKESVLVAPKDKLASRIYGDYVPYDDLEFRKFYSSTCRFVDRQSAEVDDSIKQFVTFTLVVYDTCLLSYTRGKYTTTSDELKGQRSVGFGGHVNLKDFDLLGIGANGFRANAARELREELFLDDLYRGQKEAMDRAHVLGYINVDDSADAKHHIAVLVLFEHSSPQLPKKGELSINQLSWIDLSAPLNDLSEFDLWSGMILRNIYQGRIRVRQGQGEIGGC